MHSPASQRQLGAILGFTVLYLVAASAASWTRGNSEFVFYIAVMVIIIAALFPVHRRIGISAVLLCGLSLWGLLHMAGGLVPIPDAWPRGAEGRVLYNLWLVPDRLKFDQLVHAFGFGITTWLCWQALSARTKNEAGAPLAATPGLMVLCAAAGMGFGALNEVVEFIATQTLPNTNVGGYVNTGLDLIFNTLGAGIAASVIYIRDSTGRRHP